MVDHIKATRRSVLATIGTGVFVGGASAQERERPESNSNQRERSINLRIRDCSTFQVTGSRQLDGYWAYLGARGFTGDGDYGQLTYERHDIEFPWIHDSNIVIEEHFPEMDFETVVLRAVRIWSPDDTLVTSFMREPDDECYAGLENVPS